MNQKNKFILASSSPRRRELLRLLGISFEVKTANVDERVISGEEPARMVARLSEEKARAVSKISPGSFVLGADTTVVLYENNAFEILGKPEDEKEAGSILSKIQGRAHTVLTGFSLCLDDEVKVTRVVSTKVRIKNLSSEEILDYIKTKEPLDKAGAYGAQGIGATFIECIEGSYTNVVGLPLCELSEELLKLGLWSSKDLRR